MLGISLNSEGRENQEHFSSINISCLRHFFRQPAEKASVFTGIAGRGFLSLPRTAKSPPDTRGQQKIILLYSRKGVALIAVTNGGLQPKLSGQPGNTCQVESKTILTKVAEIRKEHRPLRQGRDC